jgi:hypothetical protein
MRRCGLTYASYAPRSPCGSAIWRASGAGGRSRLQSAGSWVQNPDDTGDIVGRHRGRPAAGARGPRRGGRASAAAARAHSTFPRLSPVSRIPVSTCCAPACRPRRLRRPSAPRLRPGPGHPAGQGALICALGDYHAHRVEGELHRAGSCPPVPGRATPTPTRFQRRAARRAAARWLSSTRGKSGDALRRAVPRGLKAINAGRPRSRLGRANR